MLVHGDVCVFVWFFTRICLREFKMMATSMYIYI